MTSAAIDQAARSRTAPDVADDSSVMRALRAFLYDAYTLTAHGDYSRFAERYVSDARIHWAVGDGGVVTGRPEEFAAHAGARDIPDPPPAPDPAIEELRLDPKNDTRAFAFVYATSPDGQRIRMEYDLLRLADGWRIEELRGAFVNGADRVTTLSDPAAA